MGKPRRPIRLQSTEQGGKSMKEDKVKKIVRAGYAKVAKKQTSCCDTSASCGCSTVPTSEDLSSRIGYKEEEMNSVPEGANLGLGCGNPTALASIKEGEIVLDLGSGAGFDCFLASYRVGPKGMVIGVDMTSEMIEKARANARKGNYTNIDFRQGELENMPVADNYIDVVISNCVINLVPEKRRVFKEAFRVLKPGGRLAVSDIVLLKDLPDFVKTSTEAYIGCLAGAIMKDSYIEDMRSAGFQDIQIVDESSFPIECLIFDAEGLGSIGMPKA